MERQAKGQESGWYDRVKAAAIKFDSIALKAAEIGEKVDALNARNPDDLYHWFEDDVVALLDVLYDVISTPCSHVEGRLVTSIASIPRRDLVNAILLAYGRDVKRHVYSDGTPSDTSLGGRKSRVRDIRGKLALANEHLWKLDFRGFFAWCERIEGEYRKSTIYETLRKL